jgi:dCMP deaminase
MTAPDRPTWDETWMSVADTVAPRSRCSRARVGAVVVSRDQRVSSTGYNGPPANWPEEGECAGWCERAQGLTPMDGSYTGCPSIHAEANALLYVDRSRVEGGTIYVTAACCAQCAKLISNSGVARVVMRLRDVDRHRQPEEVVAFLEKCGVTVTTIEGDTQ